MGEYNNQLKVGIGEGLEGGEIVRWAIIKGGTFSHRLGGQISDRKIKIEKAMGPGV